MVLIWVITQSIGFNSIPILHFRPTLTYQRNSSGRTHRITTRSWARMGTSARISHWLFPKYRANCCGYFAYSVPYELPVSSYSVPGHSASVFSPCWPLCCQFFTHSQSAFSSAIIASTGIRCRWSCWWSCVENSPIPAWLRFSWRLGWIVRRERIS